VNLRRATLTDLPALLPRVREFHLSFGFPWVEDHKRMLLATALQQPGNTEVWLAETDAGAVVGYAIIAFWFSLELEGRTALLDEFYLMPDYRGKGAGTSLLGQLELILQRQGIRWLRLEVDPVHGEAARLYERCGFRPGRTLWSKALQPSAKSDGSG